MYSDTVRQQNHPQVPTVHLIDFRPTANTTIFLHRFGLGKFNDTLDPFVLDYGTIRTVPEHNRREGAPTGTQSPRDAPPTGIPQRLLQTDDNYEDHFNSSFFSETAHSLE